jgi:hypothetical protein
MFSGFAPTPLSLFVLYFPPLFLGWLVLHTPFGRYFAVTPEFKSQSTWQQKTAPRVQCDFQILDAAIMNAFETMLKLCGYIVLFAVICGFISNLFPLPDTVMSVVMNILEISNGTQSLKELENPIAVKYFICFTALSFGGISCLCQTYSMIKPAGLSIRYYIRYKLCCCLMTTGMVFIYVMIF